MQVKRPRAQDQRPFSRPVKTLGPLPAHRMANQHWAAVQFALRTGRHFGAGGSSSGRITGNWIFLFVITSRERQLLGEEKSRLGGRLILPANGSPLCAVRLRWAKRSVIRLSDSRVLGVCESRKSPLRALVLRFAGRVSECSAWRSEGRRQDGPVSPRCGGRVLRASFC